MESSEGMSLNQTQRELVVTTIQVLENQHHFLAQNQLKEFYIFAFNYLVDNKIDVAEISSFTDFFLEQGVNILDYLNVIPRCCFYMVDHPSIENMIIPNHIDNIGEEAFAHSAVKHLVIPESVKFIDWSAFEDCTALESVELYGNPKMGNSPDIAGIGDVIEFDEPIKFICHDEEVYEFVTNIVNKYNIQWEVIKK